MKARRSALGPVFGLLCLPVAALPTAGQSAAPVIDSIVIQTHDVFDSLEVLDNRALGLANAIHATTRPHVVRRELLFREGEPFDFERVLETARNLRAMGLFRDVGVDTFRVDGRLVVRVRTYDGWSTSLELNARSTGGAFTWSTGIAERNFLGTGDYARLRYRHDADRNATTVEGRNRRLLGTILQGSAYYDKLSDGYQTGAALSRPFRSFSGRRSFESGWELARRRVLRFRDGALFEEFQQRYQRVGLRAAVAPVAGAGGYLRVGLWGFVKDDEYVRFADTALAVPDTVVGAAAVFAEWRRSRFVVVTHFNGFAREEDVDLSTWLFFGGWVAPAAFGYPRTGIGPFVDGQTGVPLGRSFLRLYARANGLFTSAGLDSGRVAGGLTFAARVFPRQATVLHLEAGAQRGPPPGAEFDLGHGAGPRSFRPHAFSGTRTIWGTLEHRVFLIDELTNLLSFGFAVFLDYGGAWYPDQPRRLGGDIGFGLRLGGTRAAGPNVGRFDLAYRFGDGFTGGRWVFSTGRSFTY